MLQPKRVPRKGRHYNYAPVKSTGVPIETVQASCCEKTRKERSDSFHRKLMMPVLPQWLVDVEGKSKEKTKSKIKTRTNRINQSIL